MSGTDLIREIPDTILDGAEIAVVPSPSCPLCGVVGTRLYEGMSDWLWGISGDWGLRTCRCGIAWLDPRPIAEDIPKLYARYYTHCGVAEPGRLEQIRREMLKSVLARLGYAVEPSRNFLPRLMSHVPSMARARALEVFNLPASDTGTLLDVGCGNGAFIRQMHSLGWDVSGVDPDFAAVTYSRGMGLEVFQGTISDVPSDARYDVITLSHVIEHVPDPVALLRECRQRLRRGTGHLIIITPNINSLGHRWFGRYWRGLETPRHLFLFSMPALRECAVRAGLQVTTLRTETRLARMIYNPSACAKAGDTRIGERTDFRATTKASAYLFQALEEAWCCIQKNAGEEVYCVCTAM